MIYIILKCFKRSTFLSFFACLVIFTWISYIVNFILLLIFLYTYKYLFVFSGTKLNYLKIICCFYFLLSWNESSVYFRANSALLLRLNSYDYSTWIPCDLQFIHLLLMETGTIPGPESLWGFFPPLLLSGASFSSLNNVLISMHWFQSKTKQKGLSSYLWKFLSVQLSHFQYSVL